MGEWKNCSDAEWAAHKSRLRKGVSLEMQNAEGETMIVSDATRDWHKHRPHGWKSGVVRIREIPTPPAVRTCDMPLPVEDQ